MQATVRCAFHHNIHEKSGLLLGLICLFAEYVAGDTARGHKAGLAVPDSRARDMHAVPATTNPLGVKGVGEAGTTASIAAILNAIRDAIPGEAGARIDMPATPAKVWAAVQNGKGA
jgi:hypothetical protein